jgi:hypothetical protein
MFVLATLLVLEQRQTPNATPFPDALSKIALMFRVAVLRTLNRQCLCYCWCGGSAFVIVGANTMSSSCIGIDTCAADVMF